MGGRKVCFIDYNGQVGTCIKDDENCVHCKSEYEHFKWLKEMRTEDAEKVDYRTKISKQVHVLEQTVYGMRDLASALQRTGFEKIGEELYWRAGNIEEVMEKVDQLILASLKEERKDVEYDNAHLKQILKIMEGG
jgi:hypothetical protein